MIRLLAVDVWEGDDGALVLACPHCDSDIPVPSIPSPGTAWACFSCAHDGVIGFALT